jgi:hypothetical protein
MNDRQQGGSDCRQRPADIRMITGSAPAMRWEACRPANALTGRWLMKTIYGRMRPLANLAMGLALVSMPMQAMAQEGHGGGERGNGGGAVRKCRAANAWRRRPDGTRWRRYGGPRGAPARHSPGGGFGGGQPGGWQQGGRPSWGGGNAAPSAPVARPAPAAPRPRPRRVGGMEASAALIAGMIGGR